MKKILLLTIFTLIGLSNVCAAEGDAADWYLYYYKASDPALDGDYSHQFVETNETGVYEIAACSVPVNGLNFCVHAKDNWSDKCYGWGGANVTSTGELVVLATATSASGWMALPAGLYKVTWNTNNHKIQFDEVSVPTSVSIGETGYATFYSNCAYTMPTGLTGYIVTPGAAGAINVTETYAAGANVPRWQGVLLKGTAGDYTLTYTGSVDTAPTNRLSGSSTAKEVGTWVGDDSKNVLLYKLANDGTNGLGWYWDSDNGQSLNCAANKAYLWLTQTEAGYSSSRSLSFISLFGDNVTKINAVENTSEAAQQDGKYFENGQIVIVKNGKKYNAAGAQVK